MDIQPSKRQYTRRQKTDISPEKVGLKNIADTAKKAIFKRHFARRQLLTVPQDILDKNPDKHFVYVNMPRLEKAGMWHADGYKLYEAKDTEVGGATDTSKDVNHFTKSPDGYIHRNEMVLAWIPVEEYKQRKFDEEVVRGSVNLEDLIENNPNLASEFSPRAKISRVEEKVAEQTDKIKEE